ncbi:MAG: SGNH/GDSL hydrolase family protein [Solirubrobacterales bacterium]
MVAPHEVRNGARSRAPGLRVALDLGLRVAVGAGLRVAVGAGLRVVFGAGLRVAVAAGMLAALPVVALPASAFAAQRAPGGPAYVALGDSYSSGPLIPFPTGPPGCLRSDFNYPHLVAARLGVPLTDRTCSGARTADMWRPRELFDGETVGPQLGALGRSTSLVSLTIGGNDAGFSEVLLSCLTADPDDAPCRRRYLRGGRDLLAERAARVAPAVAAVLREVRRRAPRAEVFLLDYPSLLPARGGGCWPLLPLAAADVGYLRSVGARLNAALAGAARAGGAHLVRWSNAAAGHDACAPSRARWVEPLLPGRLAAPAHPNERGMRGAARALLGAIAVAGPQAASASGAGAGAPPGAVLAPAPLP